MAGLSLVVQHIFCVLASAAAGIGIGFFGCLLSSADRERRQHGGTHTRSSKMQCVAGVVGSTLFGVMSLVGIAFGPVALVVVVRAGATLPANAFFSQVFRLRPLLKEDYIGMLVTLSAVVSFSIFQGSPGEEVDRDAFLYLMSQARTISWLSVLVLLLILSLLYMCVDCKGGCNCVCCIRRKQRHPTASSKDDASPRSIRSNRSAQAQNACANGSGHSEEDEEEESGADGSASDESEVEESRAADATSSRAGQLLEVFAVSMIIATCSAIMDVAAKGWSAVLRLGLSAAARSPLFWVCVLIQISLLVGVRVGTIVGCNRCDVLLFVPVNTVLNILIVVITGMVALDESSGVLSWVGLVSSALSMLGGIVMLVVCPAAQAEGVETDPSSPARQGGPGDETPGEPDIPGVGIFAYNSTLDVMNLLNQHHSEAHQRRSSARFSTQALDAAASRFQSIETIPEELGRSPIMQRAYPGMVGVPAPVHHFPSEGV